MKRAPFALFLLALVVATAWPLSGAIGAATAAANVSLPDVRPAGCVPERADAAPTPEQMGLPPGHPPIPLDRLLPPGHPPIPGRTSRLPSGHPPLPSGHPPIPASPTPLFGEPVLLTI